MRSINSKIMGEVSDKLFLALTVDAIEEVPSIVHALKKEGVDLNTIREGDLGTSILQYAISHNHCFAYFLDLGLDPFAEDYSKLGYPTVHLATLYLRDQSFRWLMGMPFTDSRFPGFTMHDGTTVEVLLAKLSEEEQAAFRETQRIFYIYRGFHESAKAAANLESPDHLLAALYYFLAAQQMKTEIADKEDDDYLKRFHFKKVVQDLSEATTHYHQAILKNGETLTTLDEFNRCLALSAEIIGTAEVTGTVVPDNSAIYWEIKLGDEKFFETWREQLEALQKWRERRISFSSTSSGGSGGGTDAAETVDVEPIKETEDEITALLGLRHRR